MDGRIKPVFTRRQALTGIAAVATSAIVAACASPASPRSAPTTTRAPSPNVSPRAVFAAVDANPSGSKATLSLSYWAGPAPEVLSLMEQKTGLTVQGIHSSWHGYQEKLMTGLVAGTAPDLFTVDTYFNGEIFPSGLIVPFDDYLSSRRDVDMAKWNIDQRKENGYGGKIYGLSFFTAQDFIVHLRKDLAEKDGLLKGLPQWGASNFDNWNWGQLVDWLKAGTKMKRDGTVEQYGLGLDVSNEVELFKIFTYMSGGSEFDDQVWNYRETTANFDQPEFLEAVQFVSDLVLKHKVAPTPGEESAIPGGSYLGKRALCCIAWSTQGFVPDDIDQQAWIHLPFNKMKTHRVGANYFAVNKSSKLVDAALNWSTTFCIDVDVRTKFFQTGPVPAYDPLPIVNAASDGPAKTIALINLSRIAGMSTIPANTAGVVQYPGWDGRDPHYTDDTLTAAMQSVTVGGRDVKSAFAAAKAKIEADLAKKK